MQAGFVKPHTHFTAEIYVLSKEEGGRHTPFFNNYRPQFYFRTTDVTGAVELPKDKEMVMPGDNVSITVKLIAPIAMEEGLRFAIREGGRTVGAGVVAKITNKPRGKLKGYSSIGRASVSKTKVVGSIPTAPANQELNDQSLVLRFDTERRPTKAARRRYKAPRAFLLLMHVVCRGVSFERCLT